MAKVSFLDRSLAGKSGIRLPRVQTITTDRPFSWLRTGWRDLTRNPRISIGYGLIAVAACYLILISLDLADALSLFLPMLSGFMLIGPLISTVFQEISRRIEKGQAVTFAAALGGFGRRPAAMFGMAALLVLIYLAWVETALLIFGHFFGHDTSTSRFLIGTVFDRSAVIPFLITSLAVGCGMAGLVFSLSVVSLSLLSDREIGVLAAIATSLAVVRHNFWPMLVWAGLLVLFTGVGLAFAFCGLAVTQPLLGHASWHAYRDLVGRG